MTKSLDNLQRNLIENAAIIEISLRENINIANSQLVVLHAAILQAVEIIKEVRKKEIICPLC